MNSVDELTPECLGFAGVVYEHVLVSTCACDSLLLLLVLCHLHTWEKAVVGRT